MAKITPVRVTEQFEHFVRDRKEGFWARTQHRYIALIGRGCGKSGAMWVCLCCESEAFL